MDGVHVTHGPEASNTITARLTRRRAQQSRVEARRHRHAGNGSSARRHDLPLEGEGVRCTAWEWWPDGPAGTPCTLVAYGYSGSGSEPPSADDVADARPIVLPGAIIDAIGAALGQAPCRDDGRFLTTVLITDIVDSTGTATRLGDRRWGEMLAEHYAACRAQVTRYGGEFVNTTGDGIVAIFDVPARAVRAAIAIQAAARAAGVAVRAGLHTGECERLGEGLVGVAIHIAARVCALGGAGDVLATGTVRDLATCSVLTFEVRGEHELKGVPGRWPVFSVSDPSSARRQYPAGDDAPGSVTRSPAGDTTNHVPRKPSPSISPGLVSAPIA
jgi:class 3 adenylate cyclase